MKVLITGAAGFIGYHLCKRCIEIGYFVIGFDNLNNYYDVNLKKSRLNQLEILAKKNKEQFIFIKGNLEDKKSLENIFKNFSPEYVVNLAAQAGVRYSLKNPDAYLSSNLLGFGNIIELCRKNKIKNFLYASSSSVYGGNTIMPFSEKNGVNHPISLYAASKRANELIAHSYSNLYSLPCIGLRFFTVYGPWGRPDMALFLFTNSIINNKPIQIFNKGKMLRDFTYIDDVIESLVRLLKKPPIKNRDFDFSEDNPGESWAPFIIYNIGNSKPTSLLEYIIEIEKNLGKKAIKEYLPMQPGDVKATYADTSKLEKAIDYKPKTSIKEGVANFIEWYGQFYSF
tara:strand:- start:31534 stop:32556 length:1023 start_codon:yes stop_codon:yes gene_type:complete